MTEELERLRAENQVLRQGFGDIVQALGVMMRMADDSVPMLEAVADIATKLEDHDLAAKARAMGVTWSKAIAPLKAAMQIAQHTNSPSSDAKN